MVLGLPCLIASLLHTLLSAGEQSVEGSVCGGEPGQVTATYKVRAWGVFQQSDQLQGGCWEPWKLAWNADGVPCGALDAS